MAGDGVAIPLGTILGVAFVAAVFSWWFCRGRVQAWWLRRHPEDAPNVYPHNVLRPPPGQPGPPQPVQGEQYNNVPTAVPIAQNVGSNGGQGGYGGQPSKPYGGGYGAGAPAYNPGYHQQNVPVASPV
mmetsp:Transcript_14534/g.35580  ORF Transcript_14534/g.35580 Transcript_14534/m.35580 type:complete len:128 (-) Transcript_14534:320-703(-)|eukprot:CAMPEP_0206263624 /NCGR_PEP_ID=MMETSP0047_2-20121206/28931_1 /ASSEMBLY_ACC=CAM_ASM_000192 /TAXON_ID=195065 /ORGANISM="Chroomonas mesostigmatica_cf, Strain CCMP1168" /LENGTH=127 /DNA_ID=CAMNT_0053691205 /DNA_START=351 /DNA_END=734 /DNA_ORIENTATION=+